MKINQQRKAILRDCFLRLEKVRTDIMIAKETKKVKLTTLESDILGIYGKLEFLDKLLNNE